MEGRSGNYSRPMARGSDSRATGRATMQQTTSTATRGAGGGLEGLQGQQSFQKGFTSTAGQGKSGMTGLKLSWVIGRGTKNPQHSRRPGGASKATASLHIQGWLSCRYDSTADPLTGAGGLPGLSLGQLRVRPLEPVWTGAARPETELSRGPDVWLMFQGDAVWLHCC